MPCRSCFRSWSSPSAAGCLNDIPKGKPWFDELTKKLDTIAFAIVCVTEENRESPWMLWEAGFLSSASTLGDRHVVPLAIGFDKGSIGGPLSIYQAADTSRDDMLRLLRHINLAVAEDRRIPNPVLEASFQMIWPTLDDKLKQAIAAVIPAATASPPRSSAADVSEMLALQREQQRQTAELKASVDTLTATLAPSGAVQGGEVHHSHAT
jgi:hypothetical protein